MKRRKSIATPLAVATLTEHRKAAVERSPAKKGALNYLQILVTRELMLRLRDVHQYWSTPRISPREIEQLKRQDLIQRSTTGICAIRLTEQGALLKNGGQSRRQDTLHELRRRPVGE